MASPDAKPIHFTSRYLPHSSLYWRLGSPSHLLPLLPLPLGSMSTYNLPPAERQCTATTKSLGNRCTRPAMRGAHVCNLHGGMSPLARAEAKRQLMCMLEPAFAALMRAMDSDDMKSAVRAAEIILDRAGFGPKATLEIEDTRDNLANTSGEELLKRIDLLKSRATTLLQAKNENVVEGEVTDSSVH